MMQDVLFYVFALLTLPWTPIFGIRAAAVIKTGTSKLLPELLALLIKKLLKKGRELVGKPVRKLLCCADQLGRGNIDDIRQHPFHDGCEACFAWPFARVSELHCRVNGR